MEKRGRRLAHHVGVLVWVRHTDFSQLDIQVLKCKGCYVIALMGTATVLIQWNAAIHMTTLNWVNSTLDKHANTHVTCMLHVVTCQGTPSVE